MSVLRSWICRLDSSHILPPQLGYTRPREFYLLGVSTVSDRFIVVVFKYNVTKETVGNIFDHKPFDREVSRPSILLPVLYTRVEVNRSNHLGHPTKLGTGIHLKLNIFSHSSIWSLSSKAKAIQIKHNQWIEV